MPPKTQRETGSVQVSTGWKLRSVKVHSLSNLLQLGEESNSDVGLLSSLPDPEQDFFCTMIDTLHYHWLRCTLTKVFLVDA